ncbi:MAG: pseudouridine synthase [Polyangiaceae bacterium]
MQSPPRSRTLRLQTSETAKSALAKLAPTDLGAIVEGRLFVDSRRITDENAKLGVGQSITLHAPHRELASNAVRSPEILDEREGILAIDKPAEWSSEPDERGDRMSLSRFVLQNTKYLSAHVATRLDVGVSGVVLVATTETSRRHLSQLSEQGQLHRHYVAIALGALGERGRWEGSVEDRNRGKESPCDHRLRTFGTTTDVGHVRWRSRGNPRDLGRVPPAYWTATPAQDPRCTTGFSAARRSALRWPKAGRAGKRTSPRSVADFPPRTSDGGTLLP